MALLKSAAKVTNADKFGAGILALSILMMIFLTTACGSIGGKGGAGGSAQNGQPGQDGLDGKPRPKECYDVKSPFEAPFLKKAIDNIDGLLVVKYPFRDDGWAYLVQGDHAEVYDCVGTLLCETKTDPERDCMSLLGNSQEKGRIIWQVD